MLYVASPADLYRLGHELAQLKDELQQASSIAALDAIVDRYEQAKLFHRIRPSGRGVLMQILQRRYAELAPA